MKWLGPLPVMERVGAVAYRLQLPGNLRRLHNVFHVSLLKPFVGSAPSPREPVFTTPDEEEDFEVEAILDHRIVRSKRQYLLQWKGYPLFEATWEPEEHLSCPELLSEYKTKKQLD